MTTFKCIHQTDLINEIVNLAYRLLKLCNSAAWVAENEPLKLNELLAQHLLPWAFHYLNKLQANVNFPFYVGLAELAQLTLTGWQNSLKIDVADKEIFFR